jgi:phosphomannomutase
VVQRAVWPSESQGTYDFRITIHGVKEMTEELVKTVPQVIASYLLQALAIPF